MRALRSLRWLIVAAAIAVAVVTATQPLYVHVTPLDRKSLGHKGDSPILRDYFVTGRPATEAQRLTSALLKVGLLLAVAAVIAGAFLRRRRAGMTFGGAIVAITIAIGLSLYVLLASDVLWWDGLTWLWGAVLALLLVAATSPRTPRVP